MDSAFFRSNVNFCAESHLDVVNYSQEYADNNFRLFGNKLSLIEGKLDAWRACGFRDALGAFKVLRMIRALCGDGHLTKLGCSGALLTYGDYTMSLNRYVFLLCRNDKVLFRWFTLDYDWIYLLPSLLGLDVECDE